MADVCSVTSRVQQIKISNSEGSKTAISGVTSCVYLLPSMGMGMLLNIQLTFAGCTRGLASRIVKFRVMERPTVPRKKVRRNSPRFGGAVMVCRCVVGKVDGVRCTKHAILD